MRLSLAERLERMTAYCPVSGCWFWLGTVFRGYGQIGVAGKTRRAHRVSYELHRGPIPPGLTLDHLCKQRSCINPDHLEPVTNGVNSLRGESFCAKNLRKTHCKHGHEFTPENTKTARRGRARGCRECARLWACSPAGLAQHAQAANRDYRKRIATPEGREKQRVKAREQYLRHREKKLADVKAYYLEHRAEKLAYAKQYHLRQVQAGGAA